MKSYKNLALYFTFLIFLLVTNVGFALAQVQIPGRLDTTFGNNGLAITSVGGRFTYCNDLKVQSDGKIICVGYGNFTGVESPFIVIRYNSDGSLDSTFDGNGIALIRFGSKGNTIASVPISVNIQKDGKLVVVGYTNIAGVTHFAIARLNTDGSLDESFDSDGKVVTQFENTGSQARASAIHPDGKIVVAGITNEGTNRGVGFAKYNSDGSLDTSFDDDGKLFTLVSIRPNKVLIQPDGKIVVSSSGDGTTRIFRFNSNGTYDNSFSDDGKLSINIGAGLSRVYSLAIDNDGKIVFAGIATPFDGFYQTFSIGRLNTNGTLDTTFGTLGYVIPYLGIGTTYISASPNAILIQPNGKIVVAGSAQPAGPDRFAIVKFNPNGSLDTSFNGDGKVFTVIPDYSSISGIGMQPDGKLVVGGRRLMEGNTDIVLARYHNECSVPNSCFNAPVKGRVLTSDNKPIRRAIIRAIRSDGLTKYGFSNPFGYYSVKDLLVGEVYTFNVTAKGETFEQVTIKLTQDNINGINIIANP